MHYPGEKPFKRFAGGMGRSFFFFICLCFFLAPVLLKLRIDKDPFFVLYFV